MRGRSPSATPLLIAGMLLLAFGTPLRVLWADPSAPWWVAFVVWGSAIIALYCTERARPAERHESEDAAEEGEP